MRMNFRSFYFAYSFAYLYLFHLVDAREALSLKFRRHKMVQILFCLAKATCFRSRGFTTLSALDYLTTSKMAGAVLAPTKPAG